MSGKSLPEDGGMFPSWFAAQMAKRPDPQLPERLKQMHRVYGVSAGHTCKHCRHCLAIHHHDKRYRKCELYRISRSTATDWRVSWPACGRFEERDDGS